MPITLSCPSCGKRFRARDESAGKRVKCPFCAAAVAVPTAEEAAATSDPHSSGPMPAPSSRSLPALDPTGPISPPEPRSTPVHHPINPFGADATPPARPTAALPVPSRKPAARPAPARTEPKTPEQSAAAAWKAARAGLFWVLFALFLFTIPGFVGFGKIVYVRSGQQLPQGDGWVSIPGYVNTDDPGAIRMSKPEQLDAALYAIPVLLGGLFLALGRITCGAAPRNSGAKGMFAFSGLFTLLALAGLVVAAACDKLLFKETYKQAALGFLILAAVAEFWFLAGLAASGLALKRPAAARAVGLIGLVGGLTAAVATVGWQIYYQEYRPKPPDDEWKLYEQSAFMLGWLLLIGIYWRAVSSVRAAISDYVETVQSESRVM